MVHSELQVLTFNCACLALAFVNLCMCSVPLDFEDGMWNLTLLVDGISFLLLNPTNFCAIANRSQPLDCDASLTICLFSNLVIKMTLNFDAIFP